MEKTDFEPSVYRITIQEKNFTDQYHLTMYNQYEACRA